VLWIGIREDTIFVPNTFGPMQKMGEELGTPTYEPANLLTDLVVISDAFVVVVVGGMGNLPGAYVASVLIAVLQAFGIDAQIARHGGSRCGTWLGPIVAANPARGLRPPQPRSGEPHWATGEDMLA